MVEESLMKLKFTRNTSCVDPKLMATDPDESVKRFSLVLEMLGQSKWMSAKDADESKIRFQQFLSHDLTKKQREISLFQQKKWSGWMFFFLSLLVKWLNVV